MANSDQQIAGLRIVQQEAEALGTLGLALPSTSARGVYTRNQYEASVDFSIPGSQGAEPTVIQAKNQLDAYFQFDVPLLDLATWARVSGSRSTARATAANAKVTLLDVEKQVVRAYYQLVGAEALREAGEQTLQAAEQNLALTRERLDGGVATELDVDRAAAEVERARQTISDAHLSADLALRSLRTLTGLVPEGEAAPMDDDLHEEAPLESWAGTLQTIPSVVASAEQRAASDSAAFAAKLAFLPKVTASAQEHVTNAQGFTGHDATWLASVTATWKLDVSTFATVRSQEAAARIARVQEEAARQRALDQIYESWSRVQNGIAKGRATRAEAQASASAVRRARERYQQGAGTQLELVQAERDAFSAEVSRIQADADLAYARATLRLDAGHPLSEERAR